MFTVTEKDGEIGPLQSNVKGYTENDPETEVDVYVTVIMFVLLPEVIITPDGKLQLYPLAPKTGFIEYIFPVSPWHTAGGPVIEPGGDRQFSSKVPLKPQMNP